jgi:hypothetical protein
MAKEQIVKIARQVVAGEIDPLEGCRTIVSHQDGLSPGERSDPALVAIVAIESETDHLAIGRARQLWSRWALLKQDVANVAWLPKARKEARKACRALIESFG